MSLSLPYGRTHCRNGHLLTPQTAYIAKNKYFGVTCKICRASHAAAYRTRKAAREAQAVRA